MRRILLDSLKRLCISTEQGKTDDKEKRQMSRVADDDSDDNDNTDDDDHDDDDEEDEEDGGEDDDHEHASGKRKKEGDLRRKRQKEKNLETESENDDDDDEELDEGIAQRQAKRQDKKERGNVSSRTKRKYVRYYGLNDSRHPSYNFLLNLMASHTETKPEILEYMIMSLEEYLLLER